MVTLDEEPALIEASRRGDPEAFMMLITRYQKMLHALTFRMSGSEADAADLAQEAFVQAWRHLDGFRGEAKFSSWIYRIAVNLCLTWKSQQVREEQAKLKWGEEAVRSREGVGDTETRSQLVHQALLKLPAKQRAAVILTTYDGLSHAEAGRVLGCSETTVSWRVFAARAKLKRALRALAPKTH